MMEIPENLIIVTLDCVRPDHLGCYGYGGVQTPNIDALAMEGVIFEQAITHAPNTWVAHGSIFTGCNPYVHGLRTPRNRLGYRVETIAERLSRKGYRTAGFPGNSLVGRAMGFDRGFQYFDEENFQNPIMINDIAWRREWRSTVERIDGWISEDKGKFFLWIHYIDTHHLPEIDLPEYYRKRFSPNYQFYDGKISYADEVCVGAIRRMIERKGLLERTMCVILSDHGEELGNDDIPRHDRDLKDEVIKVPLIFSWPGFIFNRRRIAEQVRCIDIMPTALELLGLDLDIEDDFVEGASLVPLMKGPCIRDEGETYAYIENLPRGLRAVRTDEWKLIIATGKEGDVNSRMEVKGLYHLPSDPAENRDLSCERPSVLEYMREKVCDFIERDRGVNEGFIGMDEGDRRRVEIALKELGYME